MKFNVEKCKVIHVGKEKQEYRMDGVSLGVVEEEKDLRLWMENSMKPTHQCEPDAKQANVVPGLITKSFHYRSARTLAPLFKTEVEIRRKCIQNRSRPMAPQGEQRNKLNRATKTGR